MNFRGSVCAVSLFCAAALADLPNAAANAAEAPAASISNILEKARAVNQDLSAALKAFVCHEEIQRFKGSLTGETGGRIDTITATLSFENGTERYSEIKQNSLFRRSISSLTGAWSEGEFGTLLLQTQQLLAIQNVEFQAFAEVNGTRTAIYRFNVSESDSPWELDVGGGHYNIPFRTEVWIAVQTGEILKIERTSISVPAATLISQVEWSVELQRVDLNGKQWLLPMTSAYAVTYEQSNRKEWNIMNFSDYRRYGSQVALRFDNFQQ